LEETQNMSIAGIPFGLVPGCAILRAGRARQPLRRKAAKASTVTSQVHK
jgi:hypothetical protein